MVIQAIAMLPKLRAASSTTPLPISATGLPLSPAVGRLPGLAVVGVAAGGFVIAVAEEHAGVDWRQRLAEPGRSRADVEQ